MPMYVSNERPFPHGTAYTIHFFGGNFRVIVTSYASTAAHWLSHTVNAMLRRNLRGRLVVGVGVQWNPFSGGYAPAHTLTLCVGNRCLIFQLALAAEVPVTLRQFLLDTDVTFVGLWNEGKAARLMESAHRLEIHRLLDLRYFVRADDGRRLITARVEEIAAECLGIEGVRIRNIICKSKWDAHRLSEGQVLQAAVIAHVSFLIGRNYRAWEIRD